MGVMTVYDEHDMHAIMRGKRVAEAVVEALLKKYPKVKWMVDLSEDGTICTLKAPQLDPTVGYVLHTNQETTTAEKKAYRFASEMLERYRVGREKQRMEEVKKNWRGIAEGDQEGLSWK